MCTVMLVISFEQKEASVNLLLSDLNFSYLADSYVYHM